MSNRENKLRVLNTTQIRTTRNGLDIATRQASIEALNGIVVELIDTMLAARQAQWNVRDSAFITLRELFDRVAVDLKGPTDMLAERSAALGGIVRGTSQAVASESKLKPYPVLSIAGDEHIEAMSARLESLSHSLSECIQNREDNGDPVTLDHLVQTCVVVDRLLWLVGSHTPKLQ